MQFRSTIKVMACVLLTVFAMIAIPAISMAQSSAVKRTEFTGKDGRSIIRTVIPGSPPPAGWDDKVLSAVSSVDSNIVSATAVIMPGIPAFDWSYGCTPTSASMFMGYFDRNGYPNFYKGPANGGVVPLNNSVWGEGENPISATHIGIDGRTTFGHVEDYWDPAGGLADPYIDAGRAAHANDCIADFMGTSAGDNENGGSIVYNFSNGDPWFPDEEYPDCSSGIANWLESVGISNMNGKIYNQVIPGIGSDPNKGFTFAQFKAEIDAGRPVLIHVEGHTMLGVGYEDPATVYLHTTWDYTHPTAGLTTHMMTWGGSFQGMAHFGVTVIGLPVITDPEPPIPTTHPTIIERIPLGINVDTDGIITIGFSDAMNPVPTQGAFSITPAVTGTFNWIDGNSAFEFIPDNLLANNTTYTVTVTTAAKDMSGNTLDKLYTWDFTTGAGYRGDGMVYNATTATYLGDNIYNTTSASQSVVRNITTGAIATYYVRMQNDGMNFDKMKVQGIAGDSGWTIKYINSADGSDVTSEIVAGTWYSKLIAPSSIQALKILVTADATVPVGSSLAIPINVSTWHNPDEMDCVKITNSVKYGFKPDTLAYQDQTASFIGNNVYNTTGLWQSETHMITAGTMTTYYARYQNDGYKVDKLKLTGPAGNTSWTVKYIDFATDTDITAAVTGSGWTSANLVEGVYGVIKIEVTPAVTVPNNSVFSLSLTTTSVSSPTLTDVAKFITTTPISYQADAMVYQALTSSYIKDNLYNSTGADQTETRAVQAGVKTTYYVRGQNDGNVAQKLIFRGYTAPTGWTVKYIDSATGNDITEAVTGEGWMTANTVPATASRYIKVEVTPGAAVSPSSRFDNLVKVSSTIDSSQSDTVKCSTTISVINRVDVLPYQASTSSYIGNNIYNLTGAGQTETRSLTAGSSTNYYVRIQNDGNYNESLLVFGPAGDSSWGIKYIDSATGTDITADVTGYGWTSALLTKNGGTRSLKIVVTASATLPLTTIHDLLLTVTSSMDTSVSDTAKFQTTIH